MIPILICIALVLALLAIWVFSVQRELAVMNHNANCAMSQIGVQLSSRFDVLLALLSLVENFAPREAHPLAENVRFRRSAITAQSAPEEVLRQEKIISEALSLAAQTAEQYPQLAATENYEKYLAAVESYEKMIRTSRLIYNDSVTKLNRALRTFPTNLLGGVMGFHQREHLEMAQESMVI